MSEENNDNDSSSKEKKPPRPDVPVPPEGTEKQSRKKSSGEDAGGARFKMADEVESGRSPYNFSPEVSPLDFTHEESDGGRVFSIANVAAVVALVALIGAGYMGWKMFTSLSGEIDRISHGIEELSEQLKAQREAGRVTGKAVTRSELRQTLTTLDSVIALGDAEVTDKALDLRGEVLEILSSMEPGAPSSPEPQVSDVYEQAPLEPVSGGFEETRAVEEYSPAEAEPDAVVEEVPTAGEEALSLPEEAGLEETTPLGQEQEDFMAEPLSGTEGEIVPAEPDMTEEGNLEQEPEEPLMEPVSPLDIEVEPITPEEEAVGAEAANGEGL